MLVLLTTIKTNIEKIELEENLVASGQRFIDFREDTQEMRRSLCMNFLL